MPIYLDRHTFERADSFTVRASELWSERFFEVYDWIADKKSWDLRDVRKTFS
jgi:hypothetical protein